MPCQYSMCWAFSLALRRWESRQTCALHSSYMAKTCKKVDLCWEFQERREEPREFLTEETWSSQRLAKGCPRKWHLNKAGRMARMVGRSSKVPVDRFRQNFVSKWFSRFPSESLYSIVLVFICDLHSFSHSFEHSGQNVWISVSCDSKLGPTAFLCRHPHTLVFWYDFRFWVSQ